MRPARDSGGGRRKQNRLAALDLFWKIARGAADPPAEKRGMRKFFERCCQTMCRAEKWAIELPEQRRYPLAGFCKMRFAYEKLLRSRDPKWSLGTRGKFWVARGNFLTQSRKAAKRSVKEICLPEEFPERLICKPEARVSEENSRGLSEATPPVWTGPSAHPEGVAETRSLPPRRGECVVDGDSGGVGALARLNHRLLSMNPFGFRLVDRAPRARFRGWTSQTKSARCARSVLENRPWSGRSTAQDAGDSQILFERCLVPRPHSGKKSDAAFLVTSDRVRLKVASLKVSEPSRGMVVFSLSLHRR